MKRKNEQARGQVTARTRDHSSTLGRDTVILLSVAVLVVIGFFGGRAIVSEPSPGHTSQHPPIEGDATGSMGGMGSMVDIPEDYESLVALGNQMMDNGNYPMAAECYRRSLEITDAVDVRVDFGACLHGMGLPARAMEEFRRVLESQPEHPIAIFNMGIVMNSQQMADSARVYFRRCLELQPDGPVASQAQEYLDQLSN